MKGAFLDRDGTLIDVVRDEDTGVITTAFHPNQIRILPGVIEGLRRLQNEEFVLAIATNQPGPAKGHFSEGAVARTNDALVSLLANEGIRIQSVKSCIHHPKGGAGGDDRLVGECNCRKPKPGMLLELLRELKCDPARSWMIGDSKADVEAARAAGLRSALLFSTDRCELCPLREGPTSNPDVFGSDFEVLVERLCRAQHSLIPAGH